MATRKPTLSRALRAEASNPATSPARLKELVAIDSRLLPDVVGNPSVPLPLLQEAWQGRRDKDAEVLLQRFLQNPSFPLLLWTDQKEIAGIVLQAWTSSDSIYGRIFSQWRAQRARSYSEERAAFFAVADAFAATSHPEAYQEAKDKFGSFDLPKTRWPNTVIILLMKLTDDESNYVNWIRDLVRLHEAFSVPLSPLGAEVARVFGAR